jgi:NAD(P)-dependent dehydrogenase (short-subunit alcohol dehydrogenase family)
VDPQPATTESVAFDFTGKRVWVTGASRGLGRAIAHGFATAGADLALTARSADALNAVRDEAAQLGKDRGIDVIAFPASVSDGPAIRAVAEQLGDRWGALDVLVNCAGVSPIFKKLLFIDDDEWREVIDVNLTGTFLCTREASRLMLPSGRGSVVNISSITGQAGMERISAYSASKGAVDALTRSLAMEWATEGIRVNTVSPGYFETDMTEALRGHDKWRQHLLDRVPMARFGQPTEAVAVVLFLASDAAGFVTGANFTVDGGWTAG